MGVLATLALLAWLVGFSLFLLGKFHPGLRPTEPVRGDKESVEEWAARYLAWRCKQRRQLIKTAIVLNPDIDLEDVSPPLTEDQSLHRAAILEAAIWGYVKSLTLVDHVLECETEAGKFVRDHCLKAGWVHDPDAKPEEKEPPQTTNATIEKLRAQCKQMGLPDETLVAVRAKVLETVLERFGAQCIACRKWRLRDRVTIEQYEDTDGNGRVLKRFCVARCQPSCDTTWPGISIANGHKMVNSEAMEQAVIRTGGVPEVVIGPFDAIDSFPDEPLDDAIRNYVPPPPTPKKYSPGGVIKPGGRV